LNIEARYPEYKERMAQMLHRGTCAALIEKTEGL
jgi:hypothetical protein